FELLVEHIDNLVDVLVAQAVLVAIFNKALAGVDHEDTAAAGSVFLIDDNNAGRDAGTVEQVGRQSNDALDVPFADDVPSNITLGIATKENTVRQDHRAFPAAFK